MLDLIVLTGALTAGVVFSVSVLLKISHFSSVKQIQMQTKQRAKDEIQC